MKRKGDAVIIFCNDSAEFVLIGNLSEAVAVRKRDELKKADKHKHVNEWHDVDAESYERRFIWHIKYAKYEMTE